jgi:c-di-GMP-binding flagellar brake protein YcgR
MTEYSPRRANGFAVRIVQREGLKTMSVTTLSERRRFPRHLVIRACKVRDCRTARFLPATTTDVSDGGALLRLERTRPLAVGDELDLYVGDANAAVISSDVALRAVVRRVSAIDQQHQAVALEFERAQADVQGLQLAAA